jgi:hypothetical protein
MGLLDWIRANPVTSGAIGAAGLGAAVVASHRAHAATAPSSTPAVPSPPAHPATTSPQLPAGTARTAHPSDTPAGYAQSYLARERRDWGGSLGTAVRRMTPLAWPGVPPEVIIGFTTNGAQTANTALSPPLGVNNPFAELGYFGTEGGPRSTPPNAGPYPNPTVTTDNSWLLLHADPTVVRLLGHPATMVPDAWKTDLDAQTAIGIVNLRKRLDTVNGLVASTGASATDPSTSWAVALAFAGWSAGAAGMATWVRRYAAALRPVPEGQRVAAWANAVAADAAAGPHRVVGVRHANPAYTLMRTLQKIEAGRQLALANSSAQAGWFPVVPITVQNAITDAAFVTS